MATTTLTSEKTAVCVVDYDWGRDPCEWVKLTNKGTQRTVEILNVPEKWELFTREQQELITFLAEQVNGAEIVLKASSMRLFLTASQISLPVNAPETNQEQSGGEKTGESTQTVPNASSAIVDDSTAMDKRTENQITVVKVERMAEQTSKTVDQTMTRVKDMFASKVVVPSIALDAMEYRMDKLRGISARLKDAQFYQLEYDIPEASGKGCQAGFFRRYAGRTTLSCWAIEENDLNSPRVQERIKELENAGCVVRILPYHQRANEQIYGLAVRELDTFIRELHTSLINNIASADEIWHTLNEKMEKEASEGGEGWTEKKHRLAVNTRRNKIKQNIILAGEKLNDAIACAERFDATEDVKDLIQAVRTVVEAYKMAYNAEQDGRADARVNSYIP